MIVELIGKSLRGALALARNQGAVSVRAAVWSHGQWRVRVMLPEAR